MKHLNDGSCQKCESIFKAYDGFHSALKQWFMDLQKIVPDAHISEAGRGSVKQAQYLKLKLTRAPFGKSAHNYNAAIDVFRNVPGKLYEIAWFKSSIKPLLKDWLVWYGEDGSKFWELPHIEVKGWRELAKNGTLTLVKEKNDT